MTTEEKNKILEYSRTQKLSTREIAVLVGMGKSRVAEFVDRCKNIIRFDRCCNCGAEIVIYYKKGRQKQFCSSICKHYYYRKNNSLKKRTLICECCGKEYRQFNYLKSRFCSRECAHKHRYGIK